MSIDFDKEAVLSEIRAFARKHSLRLGHHYTQQNETPSVVASLTTRGGATFTVWCDDKQMHPINLDHAGIMHDAVNGYPLIPDHYETVDDGKRKRVWGYRLPLGRITVTIAKGEGMEHLIEQAENGTPPADYPGTAEQFLQAVAPARVAAA